MLLRFSVENAFSFAEEAVLNMVASSEQRHAERVAAPKGGPSVLRAAGVYGANGHGKTKLVEAIRFCKQVVAGVPDAIEDQFVPFKLGAASTDQPARFVVEFVTDGKQFEYGLILTAGRIDQEWLYEQRGAREVLVFSREARHDAAGERSYEYQFGAELKRSTIPDSKFKTEDYLQFLGAGTPATRSFLFEAADRKVVHVAGAWGWFHKTLQTVGADANYAALQTRASQERDFLAFLNERMIRSDTGIDHLDVRRTPVTDDVLSAILANAPDTLREAIVELEPGESLLMGRGGGADVRVMERTEDGLALLQMAAFRRAADGREVRFELAEESAGTQRLLDLYPILYNLIEEDFVYVVDELDRKLHPLLAYDFVADFLKARRGQLIFTTHTTFLLDLDLLRRDEVWFVQKKDGGSTLYSLAEFKVRPDLDIRKGYLNGRFGAIPFLGDTRALGWQADADHGG